MFLKVHKRVDSFVKELVWSFKLKKYLYFEWLYIYAWTVHQPMKETKVQSDLNS